MVEQTHDDRTGEFLTLLGTSERRISSYVLTLVPNWTDAEDIIQQTKLRLWEQYDNYDRNKDFGSWACTIAYYEVLTFRNRATRNRMLFSQRFIDRVARELVAVAAEADERLGLLGRCVEKLDQWQRDLLWRCCVAGDSIREVAEQLNRKVDSTRKALLRIRRRLHRCVQDSLHEREQP